MSLERFIEQTARAVFKDPDLPQSLLSRPGIDGDEALAGGVWGEMKDHIRNAFKAMEAEGTMRREGNQYVTTGDERRSVIEMIPSVRVRIRTSEQGGANLHKTAKADQFRGSTVRKLHSHAGGEACYVVTGNLGKMLAEMREEGPDEDWNPTQAQLANVLERTTVLGPNDPEDERFVAVQVGEHRPGYVKYRTPARTDAQRVMARAIREIQARNDGSVLRARREGAYIIWEAEGPYADEFQRHGVPSSPDEQHAPTAVVTLRSEDGSLLVLRADGYDEELAAQIVASTRLRWHDESRLEIEGGGSGDRHSWWKLAGPFAEYIADELGVKPGYKLGGGGRANAGHHKVVIHDFTERLKEWAAQHERAVEVAKAEMAEELDHEHAFMREGKLNPTLTAYNPEARVAEFTTEMVGKHTIASALAAAQEMTNGSTLEYLGETDDGKALWKASGPFALQLGTSAAGRADLDENTMALGFLPKGTLDATLDAAGSVIVGPHPTGSICDLCGDTPVVAVWDAEPFVVTHTPPHKAMYSETIAEQEWGVCATCHDYLVRRDRGALIAHTTGHRKDAIIEGALRDAGGALKREDVAVASEAVIREMRQLHDGVFHSTRAKRYRLLGAAGEAQVKIEGMVDRYGPEATIAALEAQGRVREEWQEVDAKEVSTVPSRVVVSFDPAEDADEEARERYASVVGAVIHEETEKLIGTTPDTPARRVAEEYGMEEVARRGDWEFSPPDEWDSMPDDGREIRWRIRDNGLEFVAVGSQGDATLAAIHKDFQRAGRGLWEEIGVDSERRRIYRVEGRWAQAVMQRLTGGAWSIEVSFDVFSRRHPPLRVA